MARAFVLGKPLQSSPKCVSKARPICLECTPLGKSPGLIICLGKGMMIMVFKCMGLFFYLTLEFETKLQCFLWTGSMPANGVASLTNKEAQ